MKVPLFPLHTWLPDAHTEAPTAGSVVLAGVLLKVGAVRHHPVQPVAVPRGVAHFRDFVMVLAVIGIVYGAVVAMIQTDVKRLDRLLAVSHLGFVVLGIFAFTTQGVTGSVLQMVNHGLSTGALFLLVGMLYERTRTRDLAEMGGLATCMPCARRRCSCSWRSRRSGCPASTTSSASSWCIAGDVHRVKPLARRRRDRGVSSAAIYMLWAYQRMFHGPVHEEHRRLPDLTLREVRASWRRSSR